MPGDASMIIYKRIEERMRNLGVKEYDIEPTVFNITSDHMFFDLSNDQYLLCIEGLDIPVSARLSIVSPENSLITSKDAYENQSQNRYQYFTNRIEVLLENYGLVFVPFQLEFLLVNPRLTN